MGCLTRSLNQVLYTNWYVLIFDLLVSRIFTSQTMQRVSDSWCSTIGSTAIAVVLAFCNANADLKNSDENRQEFAAQYLEHLRFLYHRADGDDAKVNTFILLIRLSCYECFS